MAQELPHGPFDLTTAQRIKLAREYLGLTQDELAKATGIGLRSIARYEGGKPVPSVRLVLLARALKVSPNALLGWDADQSDRSTLDGLSRLEVAVA